LKNSAVILAGGFSRRLGQDKGLIDLVGKPLVLHVVDRVSKVVKETVVVVGSRVQKKKFESLLGHKANVVVDKHEAQGPLVGALTGFESAKSEYSLLLPCDTPFISSQIAQFLLDICINKGAVVSLPHKTSLNRGKKGVGTGKVGLTVYDLPFKRGAIRFDCGP